MSDEDALRRKLHDEIDAIRACYLDQYRYITEPKIADYRLKPVGSDTTESRGTRLKPSEAFPAQSRLKARGARLF
jgi:hypothetical protein